MTLRSMNRDAWQEVLEESTVQYQTWKDKKLELNMARGKPCVEQLDLALGILETLKARAEFANSDGDDCRNYGVWNGLPEMRQILSDMIGVPMDQIVLGNNSSLQMMFGCITHGYTHGYSGELPWCKQEKVKFLCPSPGYDRHFAITEYFDIEMIPVPMTKVGPDMDIIEELILDPAVKGCWCVPKYSNPTGVTYTDEVVQRFAKLNPAAKDFRIFWDNAYCVHDLTDTPESLLSIYKCCASEGTEDSVLIFASTSKISFPGAGVAALGTSKQNVEELKKKYTTETIGPDKLNELRHVLFLHDINGVKDLMQGHRAILQPKFELVKSRLQKELAELDIANWSDPNGGYFINLDVMNGCAKRVIGLCKEAGVIFTDAGATYPYGRDPNDSNIRIAPSFPPLEELSIAMKVLCLAVKIAATEILLSDKSSYAI